MANIPENVRQVLPQLVPASIIKDIACFAFYDNHPRDDKNIDIILCTRMGDIREYCRRDILSSVNLKSSFIPTDIRILRNSNGELFYLVAGNEQLTILTRKEKLEIKQKLTCVDKYEITDSTCCGDSVLKITFKDNNIPVIYDDNFENFKCIDFSSDNSIKESSPIITNLMRKLTEAKYSVKCNEKTYNNFVKMRHAVAFSNYKQIYPNLDDSVFKERLKQLAPSLNIYTQQPWIKSCNKKIVVIYFVCNKNEETLSDIHILLHGTTRKSIEYTTKVFEKSNSVPFWKESKSLELKPHTESALAVVIDLEELKYNVRSKIKFNGVLIYKKCEKECVLPIHDVEISSLDSMGEDFDVMSGEPMATNITLAILASTEKTDLLLRQINIDGSDDSYLTLDLFCGYLKMEYVLNSKNIVIHRKSPYHVLNGVMVIQDSEGQQRSKLAVSVYSRSPSQVLALIHIIHDAVPHPIVITTPTQIISAKSDNLAICNETTSGAIEPEYNYENYAKSMLNRTSLVLEYLDKSMISMNESKQAVVRNKIGSEIDLFANGESCYKEFRDKMREEAVKGVEMLNEEVVETMSDDVVCID